MKAIRRRARLADPLAHPAAVRFILDEFVARVSFDLPKKEADLRRFLYAVLHVERFPASDTRRGRPARWRREDALRAASVLRHILARETSDRVSVKSFITAYLPILYYPAEVTEALIKEEINLYEAGLVARLTAEKLRLSSDAARRTRIDLIRSHVSTQGAQSSLRRRVKEILGETESQTIDSAGMNEIVAVVDEMLEINAGDVRHLFYEEMKTLFYAMREITPDDLDEEILEEFLAAIDNISLVLHRIDKKRKARQEQLNRATKLRIIKI